MMTMTTGERERAELAESRDEELVDCCECGNSFAAADVNPDGYCSSCQARETRRSAWQEELYEARGDDETADSDIEWAQGAIADLMEQLNAARAELAAARRVKATTRRAVARIEARGQARGFEEV